MTLTVLGELHCYIDGVEVTRGEYVADLTVRINLLEAQKAQLHTWPERKATQNHTPAAANGTLPV